MQAKVLKVNDGEGQVLLTYKRLAAEKGNKRLEEAFNNDQAFFFRLLGTVSTAEMIQKTRVAPREMKTDAEFCKDMEELAQEWFGKGIRDVGSEMKARLLQYAYRTAKTTIPQLSRTFGINRETVSLLLGKPVSD